MSSKQVLLLLVNNSMTFPIQSKCVYVIGQKKITGQKITLDFAIIV
jgi:hypothetical protein